MEVLIRPATPVDFKAMEELWEASVRATHTFLTGSDIDDIKRQLPDIFNNIACYVSVNKWDRIMGILGLADDQIAMLFVDPAAFGKGIGSQLMAFAIK